MDKKITINNVLFVRFIKELVEEVKKHPDCKLDKCDCAFNVVEEAFIFTASIDCEDEKSGYLCINCKKEFNKISEKKRNECQQGYYHKFVKKSDIMERKK